MLKEYRLLITYKDGHVETIPLGSVKKAKQALEEWKHDGNMYYRIPGMNYFIERAVIHDVQVETA